MYSTAESKTKKSKEAINVLANPSGRFTPKRTRKIICEPWISDRDVAGITALYEALVPRKELSAMEVSVIQKTFPTFEDIDIHMILKEAFPKFEETIGLQNFAKVKKYFGIGCKPNKKMNSSEIEALIIRLRTIENAQYYICGYKELISKLANLLEECGEEYTEIEKTKIVRMYSTLFLGYFYFVEDFAYFGTGEERSVKIDYAKVEKNNKMGFYPEELFVLYLSKFTLIPEKSILYNSISFELNNIKDKKLFKEILEFSELNIKDGKFVSVNVANPYQDFGKIRRIKQKIHHEPGVCPMEFFGIKTMVEKVDWGTLYIMYRILKTRKLDDFKKVEQSLVKFEGSRIFNSTYSCYEVIPGNCIGGELERKRYIWIVETFADKGLTIYLRRDLKTNKELRRPKKYNVGQFLSAITFVYEANLVVGETTIEREFEIADKLIKMDKKCILIKYAAGMLTIEEVKSKLGIDEVFEHEFFGIKPKVEPKDVISDFAIKNGYIESKDEIDEDLIQNVIISGNEDLIERYNSGEIDDKNFKKQLGFTSEVAKMFFNLTKIDIPKIEEKLMEAKKKNVGKNKLDHNLRLIVLLYCYIMDGQISCGPKNSVPKRNKALKTSILRTLV